MSIYRNTRNSRKATRVTSITNNPNVMHYKYTLDKSSRKYVCPKCFKKTLVRFIDNKTNSVVNGDYGRCDREIECRFFQMPNGNTPLVNLSLIKVEEKMISYHSKKELEQTLNLDYNNFLLFLRKHFDQETVESVIGLYNIGTNHRKWRNATVFWQVDRNYNIRAGKLMKYDSSTGKRIKEPYNHVSWMHRVNSLENFSLSQCLFGVHLLNLKPLEDQIDHEIRIVESEKTAIIMCALLPQYLWMATGSSANFKESLLKDVKRYKIVSYPDKTEFEKWNTVADKLNEKGYQIKTSSLLENVELENGADLIDLLEVI